MLACSGGFFQFNVMFFLLLTRMQTQNSFNGSWELLQKIPANVTSIIDDRPASRMFLNTWIINWLVASQAIKLETQETTQTTLIFGRIRHWGLQNYVCWYIANIITFMPWYPKISLWLVLWMAPTTPDFQNYNITNTCHIFSVRWLQIWYLYFNHLKPTG